METGLADSALEKGRGAGGCVYHTISESAFCGAPARREVRKHSRWTVRDYRERARSPRSQSWNDGDEQMVGLAIRTVDGVPFVAFCEVSEEVRHEISLALEVEPMEIRGIHRWAG